MTPILPRSTLTAVLLLGMLAACRTGGPVTGSLLGFPAGARRLVCTSLSKRAAARGPRHRLRVVAPKGGSPSLEWTYGEAYSSMKGVAPPHHLARRGLAPRGEAARARVRLAFAGGRLNAASDPARPGLLRGELTVTDKSSPSGSVLCWFEPLPRSFRYDPARGACFDGAGKKGLRRLPLEVIRETRDGECVDFRASGIKQLPQDGITARGWNLKGADLASLNIYMAGLVDARLEGARLNRIMPFYFCLTGRVDRHTRQHRRCPAKGAVLRCGDMCR